MRYYINAARLHIALFLLRGIHYRSQTNCELLAERIKALAKCIQCQ